MSLKDDKKGVLDTIGAFTSLKEERKVPDQNNSLPSINNKKEPIPYLLDTLKTVAGTDALKELIGGMFTKFIDTTEPKLKIALKNQFTQYNSDDKLPESFKNEGVSIPVKDIDVSSKFKTSPTSPNGELLYGNNRPNFDKTAHQAIVNSGNDTPFSVVNVNYNSTTDKFKFKPNMGNNPSINTWVNQYIDDATFIDKKEIITNVMDAFYGSVTATQNKTKEQIVNELEVTALIEQLVNNNDSFELTADDNELINKKAEELINGMVYYDMGCGLMGAMLPFSGMSDLVKNISGSTDPFFTANNIEQTINESGTINPNTTTENNATIKDGFFQKLIQIFTVKLIQAVTTAPQIRMLLGITSSFQNNGKVLIENAKDDMKKFKTMIKCLINEIIKLIGEFIFNLVKTYLISLIKPVIKKIAKEKTNQYTRIIKSLTSTKK